MSVMESLTDKINWHIKVNDDSIVSKWRAEALAMPNLHWWELACNSEDQPWLTDGEHVKIPENIMSENSFDCVSRIEMITMLVHQDAHSAQCIQELRSKARYFEKKAAWSLLWTLTQPL